MVDGRVAVVKAPVPTSGEFYVNGFSAQMNLREAPLQALSRKTKDHLSQLLNGIKIFPSEEGFLRDWRGLAHFAKIKSEMITFLRERTDPTKDLLDIWIKNNSTCTLADLQTYLGQIDRWDVIDDTSAGFRKIGMIIL